MMFEQKCQMIIEAFTATGKTIATAESCTGGLLAGALTQIPGSSAVFDRGFVTYSYPAKTDQLGVSVELLANVGAVSAEVAQAMAEGALISSAADIAISITGVAGPGASDSKPEGLVYFARAQKACPTVVVEKRFGAIGRAKVRKASVEQALDMLLTVA